MKSSHILINDNFSQSAHDLRKFFDTQFENPRSVDSKRFVWDYWFLRDQYILHRTPAYHYFPEKLYMKLHKELLFWGRKNLGCWDISPPWLSYYVEGCRQELHSDVPHGPWAFVFSLTQHKAKSFSGGETMILKPQVLSYWNGFGSQQDRELKSFVDLVPVKMNRLTVFDPRYPHGVREVRGTQDPQEGRIVIHGWFTEPKTYIEGALPEKLCEAKLNEAFSRVEEILAREELFSGTLSLQISVASSGRVSGVRLATNTLVTLLGEPPRHFLKKLLKIYSEIEFPRARQATHLTVPLIFN